MIISRLPSGGGGKKSLILPDNAPIDLYSYDGKIVVKWQKPTASEVQIASYNLYWVQSSTKPTSLKGFTNKVSVASTVTEKEVTGLIDGKTYWFALESVSSEGYENASMRTANNMNAGVPYFVAPYEANTTYSFLYSNDGKEWSRKEMLGYSDCYITHPFVFTQDLKFRFIRKMDSTNVLTTVTNYDFSNPTDSIFNWSGEGNTNWANGFYNAKGLTIIISQNPYYVVDNSNSLVLSSFQKVAGKNKNVSDFHIVYCNGKFFGRVRYYVGSSSYPDDDIYETSADGKSWSIVQGNVKGNYYLLGWINGYYIVVNRSKGIFYTTDFINLVEIDTAGGESIFPKAVFYANGYLMFFISSTIIFCFRNPSDFFKVGVTSDAYPSGSQKIVVACKNGIVAYITASGTATKIQYIVVSNIKKGGTVKAVDTGRESITAYNKFYPNVNINTINL